jgi:DNA-binding LytR/AlgR family response regulator
VRMRMSDALAMLEGEDGVKPHRSWWVARAAVSSLCRQGSRTIMRIPDGTEVPVSRSARGALGPLFNDLSGGVG